MVIEPLVIWFAGTVCLCTTAEVFPGVEMEICICPPRGGDSMVML